MVTANFVPLKPDQAHCKYSVCIKQRRQKNAAFVRILKLLLYLQVSNVGSN